MAVSTDTIQMLLRQRQDLREALLNLRKEIETLDATSLDLVNRNIKSDPSPVTQAPVVAPAETPAAPAPAPAPAPTPTPAADTVTEAAAPPPAPKAPAAPDLPSARQEPTLSAPEKAPEKASEKEPEKSPEKTPDAPETPSHKKTADEDVEKAWEEGTATEEEAFSELLDRARMLSNYFLDHPAQSPPVELGALDSAISVSEKAKTPTEKAACYHTLQAAYRKISAANFETLGLNGKTLQDSLLGTPLLWTIPLSISLLIFVFFPLLLLARHLTGEMFTDDFASDLTWSIGLAAAYLWGTVGALSLLTLNIAVEVRKRRYDEAVRLSPGLRGALGGLTGALFFLLLEIWVPMSSAAADFALDLAAFAGGLLGAVLFAAIQRVLSAITARLEPVNPKPSAAAKK